MDKASILHIPDSSYAFSIDEKTFVIRLKCKRYDNIDEVNILYGNKYEFYRTRFSKKMEIKYEDEYNSYYEVTLNLEDRRLGYIFTIKSEGKLWYYSEDGFSLTYDFNYCYFNIFQYPYINEADIMRTTDWFRNSVFYQIFVERFNRGIDNKDTKYITMGINDKPCGNSFYGGDLQGIADKLEYINGLGVNALYLTPIFKSISNHKYDIMDYDMIDEMFGNDEIFSNLVKKAHSLGIRIVIDVVFNHCSNLHPIFQDVLKNGKNSKYYDFFIEKDDYYYTFADCKHMPKLNTSKKVVQDYLINTTLSWIEKYDIDGLRMDVADELSHDFLRRYRKEVRAKKEDCVMIVEDWHDTRSFLNGDEFDSTMNYPFTKACLDYFVFESIDEKDLSNRLNSILVRYKTQANQMNFNLLDSHDTPRYITLVKNDKNKFMASLSLLMFFIGVPCIYYGTEIMLEGNGDPDCRRAMDFSKKPIKEILDIISLRKNKALVYGDIKIFEKNNKFYIKRMYKGKEAILEIFKDNGVVKYMFKN